MGAVTARQRESIPAGTGTTDLPSETERRASRRERGHEVERDRERPDQGPEGFRGGREGERAVSRGARGGGGGGE